jgi:hypothetical protein
MRLEQNENGFGQIRSKKIGSRSRHALLVLGVLAQTVLLWGCAGFVSGQNAQAPSPQTYSLSGTISPTAGGNGAIVTLNGPSSATTTANSSGAYTFKGLANGTYAISPSHTGYTFNPANQNATIQGANVSGMNFTATAQVGQTYSISGTISPAAGGNGATVTLSGAASATTTANSAGNYTFSGLSNGAYTITPSRTGYTFAPASQSVTLNGANVSAVNFTATAQVGQTYSISGTISPAAGGNGATVTLSGAASATTTANSSGNYTFSGLSNGAYTVTPSRTGYTFAPTSQGVTLNGANVSAVNFTATAQVGQTYSISGTISPTAGGSGATVTLNGAASATTTTNAAGNYSFTGLANGNYAVTPSLTGYSFNPTVQAVTVNGANVSAVNFTATAQQAHSAALSWTASTSTVSGYNVYRGTVNGGPYTLINLSLVTGPSYTDTTVQSGVTYYYVTTAVDSSGVESVDSNQVTAVIP